jgi:NAD(P)-dependent dehydrogenase (short-subunit alcohol dehydrogenase family)
LRREISIRGKTVVITGATSGLGLIAAERLAALGARLVLVARSRRRGEAALARLAAQGPGNAHSIHYADLSRLAEMKRVGAEIAAAEPRIDVLINNAGCLFGSRQETEDGLERTFALNHLAPFLLTNLLLGRLERSAPARVVTVASNAHTAGRIDFDDLQGEQSYSGGRAYNQSKLANVLFTYQLAARLRASAVTVNALHPGVVRTSFGAEDPAGIQRLLVPLLRPVMKSPAQGAVTSIHLASAPDLEQVSGRYFANRRPTRSSPRSYDQVVAARLWEASADLVGLTAAPRV